jgi:uncharacterized protein (UPF0218 family)
VKLPDSIRDKFKNPLGILIPDIDATKQNIQKYLDDDSFIITVGDRTTQKMLEFELIPSLMIVDGQEKRSQRAPPQLDSATQITVDNPAAEITVQSIDVIKKALKMDPPVRILVNGEEDLLVLPVCVYAPENSVIMYGQPNEGLVIVKISSEIRNKAKNLIELMK